MRYNHLQRQLERFLLQLEMTNEARNPQSQESSMKQATLQILASPQFHAPRVPSTNPPARKRAKVSRPDLTCGICQQPNHSEDRCLYTHPNLRPSRWHPNAITQQHIRDRAQVTEGKQLNRGGLGDKQQVQGANSGTETTGLGCRGGRRTSPVKMLTRNQKRTALAELQQQQQIQPAATFVKPLQRRDPDCVPVEGLASIAKKMNVISLDSSSEERDVSHSERNAIELSESSKSVLEISSSDEEYGDEDLSSEDEDEDEDVDESDNSEDDDHGKRKSSSATLANKLMAAEVAKLIKAATKLQEFVHVLKGGDPKRLKVDDCRAYLRNYGLRISGTKPELIGRIKQHIELQEGGSRNYDRSTFIINCTGDVCKGDVVKFNQKISDKGSRTVAGRVVKESYGAQRQQHTFTVEVLWSAGYRPLAPMKQLLVKGRNLYKRKTHRQKWADEGERVRTLAEKHERGDAARQVRAMKQGRLRGYGGRSGAEGTSMKQLANPYTETLASGTAFQSAVFGHHGAAVRAQQHWVHHHTSYVPTGANPVPLGKIRQFGKPSGNVDINLASKEAPKVTGANTIPLGKIRQFGQRSENGKIEVATGGVSTPTDAVPLENIPQIWKHSEAPEGSSVSVNKQMQWSKSSPVLLSSGQSCGAQNVATSSAGGKNRLESGSCNSRQSLSVQAPMRQGAGSTEIRTQRHDGRSTSLLSRSSSPLLTRPASHFPNRPSSPYHSKPSSPHESRPFSPYQSRPTSPYQSRTSSPYQSRPSSYQSRPSSPYQARPSFVDQSRPSSPYQARPSFVDQSRPSSPYQGRPSSVHQRRPSSPHQGRPSSPYHGRPSSPFHNQPASYSVRPSSPYLNRSSSPLPSRLFSSTTSRPLSPLLSRPNDVPQTGFPCPTYSCTYRGSRLCSSGVCYYCCKRKGGFCQNPKHRPNAQ